MAQRGNRPTEPQDMKGGVRGTHGLGDAPRVGGAVRESVVPEHDEATGPEHDEATGEEHGFEMSSAIGELESIEERARRREREAAAALDELDAEAAKAAADAEDEVVLGDPRSDEEERRERGLATEKTPGPGPKDHDAGRARVQHLEDHRLRH